MRSFVVLLFFALFVVSAQALIKIGWVDDPVSPIADLNNDILKGVNLYINWTNTHGGINISGTIHTVELAVRQVALYLNQTQYIDNYHTAIHELINDDGVDLIVDGFGATVIAAPEAAKTDPNVPFMLSTGGGEDLYSLGLLNYWSSTGYSAIYIDSALDIIFNQLGQTNIALLYNQADVFSDLLGGKVPDIIATQYPSVSIDIYRNYTGPQNESSIPIVRTLMPEIAQVNSPVFFYAGGILNDVTVVAQQMRAYRYEPRLAFLATVLDGTDASLFLADNYWLVQVHWHPDLGFGTPGVMMGTSAEYKEYFDAQGQNEDIIYRAVLGSHACVAFQLGAQAAGADWKNGTVFRNAMLSLPNTTETFYTRLEYDPQGRNIAKKYDTVQLQNGQVVLIRDLKQLIYPAPWGFVEEEDEESTDVGLIVGLTVGVFVFVLCVVVVIVAVLLLVFHLKCQLLLVPKHKNREKTMEL